MIRLLPVLILLLTSLLAVFRAPAYPLWMLSIGVQEFPWIFTGSTVLVTAWAAWHNPYSRICMIMGSVAFLLFISPVVRAYLVAGELSAAKGKVPFSWWRMFDPTERPVAHRVLIYGASLTLDFYPSQRTGKRPCVVVIHGGSWSSGDSRQLPELNSRLARAGYAVAAINYRLAPRYQNPVQVEDVQEALGYLRAHGQELEIDTTAFVLLGRSAGAQIALLAAYTLKDPGIKGVIDFYGPADMVWGYSIPANPLIMDSRKVMSDYLGGRYEAVPSHYYNSSPIEFVHPSSPPTLLIHGKQDVLVAYEHSVRLNRKLADSGVQHFLLTLPWATHGFDYTLKGPGGQLSTWCVERFLKEVAP